MKYDFEFSWESTYGYAARLAGAHADRGVVVDLGCGLGVFAEPMTELGFDYHGFEFDAESVAACRARGRVCDPIDLRDFADVTERVLAATAGEPVSVVSMLDVIEHLPDPEIVVAGIVGLLDALADRGRAPLLVVSIPNVAHADIAAKLLLGRWDVTEVGLLDATHITLFTEERVVTRMTAAGLREEGRNDVRIADSEQQFPLDHPAVTAQTPLRDHLRELRAGADVHGATYQFVRAYRRDPSLTAVPVISPVISRCFSVVLLASDGTQLGDSLGALARQTDQDFDVYVVADEEAGELGESIASFGNVERVHLVRSAAATHAARLNAALAEVTGRIVTFIADGEVVHDSWIEEFRAGVEEAPGRIVRCGRTPFDPLSGLVLNDVPLASIAVPMEAVRALGLQFPETTPGFEGWSLVMAAAPLTGVHDRTESAGGDTAAPPDTAADVAVPAAVLDVIDQRSLLLPPGSRGALQRLMIEREQFRAQHDVAQQRIEALERSRYWRLTAPLRRISALRGR